MEILAWQKSAVLDLPSTKNRIFDIFQDFVDKFCIKAPVNNGTQYLITRIRHKPNIGRKNMEKIDVDGGKKNA